MCDDIDIEWKDYGHWYCKHGYYIGFNCPDCDTSSPVEVLTDRDPGDETDHDEA
jgi:hypothetical protein